MKQHLLTAGLLGFALTPTITNAQVIVNENFDGYANQAAFEAVWTPTGTVAPLSGTLTTDQFVSPGNSIRIDGTTVNSQQRNRLTFTESGTISLAQQITFSFDFYDSSASASPYRQFANLQDTTAPGSTSQLVSMGLNNNLTSANSGGNYYMARILGYTPLVVDPDGGANESGTPTSGAYFKLNDLGVGLRSTGWHNLKVIISTDDGLSTDFAFYVDNLLAEKVNNVGTAASFRSYDNIALGSALGNASNAAYYDNFYLEVSPVPEPGAAALAPGTHASDDDLAIAHRIFDSIGKTVALDENQLDAVTGLSGSGPAYVFLIIEALSDAGVKVGLSRYTAQALAAQTVLGSAKLLLETGEHPGMLKDMVTSPGGTAIAGLHTLEAGGLRTTLINAVESATRRSRELGDAALVAEEKRAQAGKQGHP